MRRENSILVNFARCIILFMFFFVAIDARRSGADEVWFGPDVNTPDLVDLFVEPQKWENARSNIRVLKLGRQLLDPTFNQGLNSYGSMVDVNAFKRLTEWGIKLATPQGAVKEWDCTGVEAAAVTVKLIANVEAAGGIVDIVAMDEPLLSGIRACGLTIEEIGERTSNYVERVRTKVGNSESAAKLVFGDIEPYPFSSPSMLKKWISSLKAHSFTPDFFQIDISMRLVNKNAEVNLESDLQIMYEFFRKEQIPFGVIFWSGIDPLNSDQAYYARTMNMVRRVKAAIGRPDQMIFQSWIKRSSTSCGATDQVCRSVPCTPEDPPYCGQRSIPLNLPENDPNAFTHTRLINDALNLLNYP